MLKQRRVQGQEVLSLFEEQRGSFAVLREWTDLEAQSPWVALESSPLVLDPQGLLKLRQLVDHLQKRIADEK